MSIDMTQVYHAIPDTNAISLAEAHAVQYWMEEFGVSQPELLEAVELMGPSPEKVRKYLN